MNSHPNVCVSFDSFALNLLSLRPELLARALHLTRNEAHAEDLVQDSIERALRFRAQFVAGTSLRSWVHTIMFSLFVTSYRRKRREKNAVRVLTNDPSSWTVDEPAQLEETHLGFSPSVSRAVDAMPDAFREVLMLVDVEEWSYRDAADKLNVPMGTVMSRLHRARKHLARALGFEEPLAA